jgi:hypothetical protein
MPIKPKQTLLLDGGILQPIRFGKSKDHFADDLSLGSGELQKAIEGFSLDMTRTFIRQLHEWIEANRYKVSCAAIAAGRGTPFFLSYYRQQSLGITFNDSQLNDLMKTLILTKFKNVSKKCIFTTNDQRGTTHSEKASGLTATAYQNQSEVYLG